METVRQWLEPEITCAEVFHKKCSWDVDNQVETSKFQSSLNNCVGLNTDMIVQYLKLSVLLTKCKISYYQQ